MKTWFDTELAVARQYFSGPRKGFRNADASRLTNIDPEFKVFWPVVSLDPVNVVDVLPLYQRPTHNIPHDKSMFINPPTLRRPHTFVSTIGDVFTFQAPDASLDSWSPSSWGVARIASVSCCSFVMDVTKSLREYTGHTVLHGAFWMIWVSHSLAFPKIPIASLTKSFRFVMSLSVTTIVAANHHKRSVYPSCAYS